MSVLSFDANKITHKNHFKKFFNRTNKRLNYEKQLLKINTRYMNLLTIVEFNIYKRRMSLTLINDKKTAYINKVLKIKFFNNIN